MRVCRHTGGERGCQRPEDLPGGRCRKGFPYPVAPFTVVDDHGRITLRRRQAGDAYVVPYNIPLLQFCDSHVCVEPVSVGAGPGALNLMAYIFRYVLKVCMPSSIRPCMALSGAC